jgi:hypothetical protein
MRGEVLFAVRYWDQGTGRRTVSLFTKKGKGSSAEGEQGIVDWSRTLTCLTGTARTRLNQSSLEGDNGNYGIRLALRASAGYNSLEFARLGKTGNLPFLTQVLGNQLLLSISAGIEITLRDHEVGGSSPLTPT